MGAGAHVASAEGSREFRETGRTEPPDKETFGTMAALKEVWTIWKAE